MRARRPAAVALVRVPAVAAVLAAALATPLAWSGPARAGEAGRERPGYDTVLALPAFAGLEVETAMRVTVVCGESPRLAVRSDPPILGDRYLDARVVEAVGAPAPVHALRMHFRRDFDRHIHPDQVSVEVTAARPLARVAAATGARVSLSACALHPDAVEVAVSTGARVELSGRTRALDLHVDSGGLVNAMDGGRGFWPQRARVTAGARSRIGLCGAGAVEIVSQAADARVLADC